MPLQLCARAAQLFARRASDTVAQERLPIWWPTDNMKKIFAAGALLALTALIGVASDGGPKRDILGLHLEMLQEDATKRLNEIGTFERDERKQQAVWQVRDPSFSHVIIGASKEGKLRFITAVARTDSDASRVPYASVGNLEQARQAGDPAIKNFRFEWSLPALKEQPAAIAQALGRDPEFLSTYSLKRIGATELPAAEE